MISKKELKDLRRKKHREWFDNWYKNRDIENSILEANSKGYTGLKLKPTYGDNVERAFFFDDLTIEMLKECFPEFDIRKETRTYTNILEMSSVEEYIHISWR